MQYLSHELNVILANNFKKDDFEYKFIRFLDKSNNSLESHVKKHFKTRTVQNYNTFYETITLDGLLSYFYNQKDEAIFLRNGNVDIYNITFPTYIANINNVLTRHYRVCTLINSDIVITLFPFVPSTNYNKEGFNNSRKLIK